MIRTFPRGGLLTACVAVAALTAGCGSNDNKTSVSNTTGAAVTGAATTSTATQGHATGSPVTVYTSTPLKNKLGDVPWIPSAINAGIRAINDHGGLQGHKVVLKVCNDLDANSEVTCVRNAAKDKAIAFVGAVFLNNAATVAQLLQKYQIPNVGALVTQPAENSSPMFFPIDAPALANPGCVALMPQVTGNKKIGAITTDLPVTLHDIDEAEQAVKKVGANYVGRVVVPANTTDFSSAVQQLSDKGAENVLMQLPPPSLPAFLQAVRSLGKKFNFCTSATQVPVDMLASLGPAAANIYLGSGLPPASAADRYPLLKEYAREIAAQARTGDKNANIDHGIPIITLRAWLGTQILEQAAKRVQGGLTNQTLLAALNKSTIDLGGLVPPLDFSKPKPTKGFERIFNPTNTLVKWDVSKKEEVSTDAKPIDSVALLAPN
jgi:ABC-type branched-subunit amino acid transport system substrate-binding protein